MNDKVTIIAGLAILLVVATFPIWYTLGAAGDASPPDLELPDRSDRSLFDEDEDYRCVEDKPYMIAHHMDLLDQWRNAVVRKGESHYTASSGENAGKRYEMSLTKTCMNCHSNRKTFCYQCHSFANVRLRCWDCHVEPKGN